MASLTVIIEELQFILSDSDCIPIEIIPITIPIIIIYNNYKP